MSFRNSIIVRNLPFGVSCERLTIYFQRNKNGGGDVTNVRLQDNDAIIEFEDEKIVDSVLQRQHKMNGRLIMVERYENKNVIDKIEVLLSAHVVDALGYHEIKRCSQDLANLNLERKNGKLIACGKDFDELKILEEELKKLLELTNKTSDRAKQASKANIECDFTQSRSFNAGGARKKSSSWVIPHRDIPHTPRSPGSSPRPKNGETYRYISNGPQEDLIKRKFSFPAGHVLIQGRSASYPPYKRIMILPKSEQGDIMDKMFAEAFELEKLFYVDQNPNGDGVCIHSSYDIFESSSANEEVYLKGNLQTIRQRLRDLQISPPSKKKKQEDSHVSPPRPVTYAKKNLPEKAVNQVPKPKIGPFPQPEGIVMNSEYHEDDLPGFSPGSGSIHLYFRCSGGCIQTDSEENIHYSAYTRTACLPGSIEGRKLWWMLQDACKKQKLFVVDKSKDGFVLKTKLELLWSNQYPREGYLESLYDGLLRLKIREPLVTPELPSKEKAHYESNSDEEEDKRKEILIKKGPHPQPEKGAMKIEKDEGSRMKAFTDAATIKMYFTFAGGKMNIKGSKPSNSYDIRHSPLYLSSRLPDSDEGRKVLCMIKEAFDQRKLFYVEKRDGEPSFRIRSNVALLLMETSPRANDLTKLLKDLKQLGISEPSDRETNSLVIPKAKTPQMQNQQLGYNVATMPSTQRQTTGGRFQPRGDSNQDSQRYVAASRLPARRVQCVFKKEDSKEEEVVCSICLGPLSDGTMKSLPCKHKFHEKCVDEALKGNNKCPYCNQPLGGSEPNSAAATGLLHQNPQTQYSRAAAFGFSYLPPSQSMIGRFGNQPANGVMSHMIERQSLPGYENCDTIVIKYKIPGGIQERSHPHPGKPYDGTDRETYLPDTRVGRDLLRMLRLAFDAGLTFTVGRSQSSGRDNQIVWNGIPHKTNRLGGIENYGYPDIDYLDALRRELNSMGIM